MKKNVFQGEIFFVNFQESDSIGSEEYGERPVVIVSVNISNRNSDVVIVCPITSRDKKEMPTHHILTKNEYKFLLYENNIVLTENITSISKKRLQRKLGQITKRDLQEIIKKIDKNFKYT